jgi:hypothetical protein
MTLDAELLTRASVTTGARERVEPGLDAVLPAAARGRQKARRVRASKRRSGSHAGRSVAIDARAFGVARRAEPGIGTRLVGMARSETSAVKPGELYLVERKPRGKGGDRDTVARGARALAVARRAEIARARGAHAVLAYPVALVDQMARRRRVLVRQIDVATIAVAQRPLFLVLVAAKAGRHLRT